MRPEEATARPGTEGARGPSALMGTYRRAPVCFVRGEGCLLFDDEGRRYLDFLSGIAVTSLGHAHPAVAEALATQARRLLHVSNLFENEHAEPLAQRLDRLVGDGERAGGQLFFANSGAEANECALKLVRRAAGPGRHVVVSAYGSFHGRTLATLHATGQPDKHEPFVPLPEGFRHVPYDDVGALERALGPDVGAVLLEPVQGEQGVVVPAPGYLSSVRALCDERGVLLLLDEVQTGLGRTGRWFAFQEEGIVPDVLTVAKSLGNGVPIGACWARPEVARAFRPGDHGSTFGGQPLAAAAAIATLDALVALDAPARARARGSRLAAGLQRLPGVRAVRGRGLLLAAVLDEGLDASQVVATALGRGLVCNAPVPGVLRFAPPLVIDEDLVDEGLEVLAGVLADALGAGRVGGAAGRAG
jgi:acetylornithine/N-succinyldiaminopimelate aminotransferase